MNTAGRGRSCSSRRLQRPPPLSASRKSPAAGTRCAALLEDLRFLACCGDTHPLGGLHPGLARHQHYLFRARLLSYFLPQLLRPWLILSFKPRQEVSCATTKLSRFDADGSAMVSAAIGASQGAAGLGSLKSTSAGTTAARLALRIFRPLHHACSHHRGKQAGVCRSCLAGGRQQGRQGPIARRHLTVSAWPGG